MRKLANLFLLLFVISALTALADQLVQLVFSANFLSGLNQSVWLACIFCGMVVYFGLAFNRHLPKLILLPMFFWLFWGLVGYWPLGSIGGQYFQLTIACGQLLLAVVLLRLNRSLNRESWLCPRKQFAGPSFSGKNLLYFFLINTLLLPVALFLICGSLVSTLIETNTAGFVQLKPDGLYITERTYQRQDKQIRLVGMIHLGEEEYYDDLAASVSGHRTLILAEGVSDQGKLLTERFSYGKLANLLGLSSQEKLNFPGKLIAAADLDEEQQENQTAPDILRADIDLQQFNPHTLEVLNALAKYLLSAPSPITGYLAFNRWAESHVTPDSNEIIMADLITKRNRSVLSYLPKALKKYDTVIIPWGALHMQGIEKAILANGFHLKASQTRQSINFLSLPYKQLWEKLRRKPESAAATKERLSVMTWQLPPIVTRQS